MAGDIIDMLDPDRPIRYLGVDDDGNEAVFYRASAVGSCIRALVAASKPKVYPPRAPSDKMLGYFDEGKRMEDHINAMWEERTERPTDAKQVRARLFVGVINDRHVYVEGSIDGGYDVQTEVDSYAMVGREYKKFRKSTWAKFLSSGVEVIPHYSWQIAAYMHALKLDAVELVGGLYDPDKDKIIDVHCATVNNPPIPLKAFRTKLAKVENLIEQGWDPSEVDCTNSYPCPWYYLHDARDVPSPDPLPTTVPTVQVELTDEWAAAIAEFNLAKEAASEADKKARQARDRYDKAKREVRALMAVEEGKPGSTQVGDTYDVSITVKPRAAYEVKETTVSTFTITAKG
jgi:hypothetical protein